MSRLQAWVDDRSARERRLLAIVMGLGCVLFAWTLGHAMTADYQSLRRRVDRAERQLTSARVLAGRLAAADTRDVSARPLVATVEAVATEVVGIDRLASLDPDVSDGTEEAAARLVGVTLAEVVRVLQRLEVAGDHARDLDLIQHVDDPTRYDATVVIERRGPA